MESIKTAIKISDRPPLLLFLFAIGFYIIVHLNLIVGWREQHFVHLAFSFLQGKLYFITQPRSWPEWSDTSLFAGHYFWPQGPFPAFLLLPFVAVFGTSFSQGYVAPILHLLNTLLLYKIAKIITKNSGRAVWLSFAYIFSSAYLYIAFVPMSWFFSQTVVTSLLLYAIYEYLNKRRWWLIGTLIACSFASRISTLPSILFFALAAADNRKNISMKSICGLLIPSVIAGGLLFLYNYFRFLNPFETGYRYQLLFPELVANRSYGLWSFRHFPTNLYYLFLSSPLGIFIENTKVMKFPFIRANPWGTSIFLTSPLFIWIKNTDISEKTVRYALATSAVILLLLLGNFGIGAYQYGYRFALDFQPFLYIALAYTFKKTRLNVWHKVLIVCSFAFNLFMALTFR